MGELTLTQRHAGKTYTFMFMGAAWSLVCDHALYGDDGTALLGFHAVDGGAKARFLVAAIRCTEVK